MLPHRPSILVRKKAGTDRDALGMADKHEYRLFLTDPDEPPDERPPTGRNPTRLVREPAVTRQENQVGIRNHGNALWDKPGIETGDRPASHNPVGDLRICLQRLVPEFSDL